MDSRNAVVLIGRLAADPELRYLPSGSPVANFSVAVNRSTRKPDGSFEDNLDGFFDCEVFGGLALSAAETLKKGAPVQVAGSLLQKKFQGNKGQQISRVELRVRSIAAPLAPAKTETTQAGTQAAAPQPA